MAKRPTKSSDQTTVTIGSLIKGLLPMGTNPSVDEGKPSPPSWDIVPLWPPDLFAVIATLSERSGLYTEPGIALSTTVDGRRRKRQRAVEAEALGEMWGRDQRGTPPREVFDVWRQLCKNWDDPVASPPGSGFCWKQAAMRLLAIADEASAGVGFVPLAGLHGTIAAFVYEEYLIALQSDQGTRVRTLPYLPYSVARAIPQDRACVLPKALIPEVGCTLRSMSHNLALLPGRGQVSAEWRMLSRRPEVSGISPENSPDIASFNLLVIPFPYQLSADAFVCDRKPDGPDVDGYFRLVATWLPKKQPAEQARLVASFMSDLIHEAEKDGGYVNAVILPETALPSSVALPAAKQLAKKHRRLEMVIAGVMSPPPKFQSVNEPPFARNAAFVARFDNGRFVDNYEQAKHHRWRVDPTQVERYRLAHVLEAGRNWWEAIDLTDRRMVFGLDARQAVVAALICEDLARYDPVLPVLASVGPNLVIALLMDGPQLRSRWPSRHAAVLADDPGSAVLTVTSLGMVRRSEAPVAVPPRDCIALWTERGQNPRELDLAPDSHALLLSLAAYPKQQKTLDIRQQRASGGLIEYRLKGCRSVALPSSSNHEWLVNPRPVLHIRSKLRSGRQ